MSTFLLVHGSWHGAWCWYKLAARLRAARHRVVAPDLLSLGIDRTPIADVSLAGWTEQVVALLDAETEPVVLVGHSRGGVVVSEVAEARPERVQKLVYLAAFLLRDGESCLGVMDDVTDSLAKDAMVPNDSDGHATLRPDAIREAFYGLCSDEDVELAESLLAPEALAPNGTPVHVTDDRFGRVPRCYIECLRDRAIPIAVQRRMVERLPCKQVFSLDTDHSPFFSTPDELAELLGALA